MFNFSNTFENFREIKADFSKVVQIGSLDKGKPASL